MKKRALTLVLALAICAPLLLVAPCAAAESGDFNDLRGLTPEIAKGYLQVVEDHIKTYGNYSQITTNQYGGKNYTPGFSGGFIRDWDQDGIPELYVEDRVEEAPGYQYSLILPRNEIWTWKDGKAVRLFHPAVVEDFGMDGDFYWVSGNGRAWMDYTLELYQNKTYITVTWEWLGSAFDEEDYGDSESHSYTVSGSSLVRLDETALRPAKDVTSAVPDGRTLYNQLRTAASAVGGFIDVKQGDFFADAVLWAVEKKITAGTGTGTFSPNVKCTVAEILTFLWRTNGSPEPAGTASLPGVDTGAYYYKAAAWALEQGLTDSFANTDCTRSMVVTYLWKLAGRPDTGTGSFSDVPAGADYAQAVAWAVETGITSGTGDGKFSPAATCTRGQIVTFLHRAFA